MSWRRKQNMNAEKKHVAAECDALPAEHEKFRKDYNVQLQELKAKEIELDSIRSKLQCQKEEMTRNQEKTQNKEEAELNELKAEKIRLERERADLNRITLSAQKMSDDLKERKKSMDAAKVILENERSEFQRQKDDILRQRIEGQRALEAVNEEFKQWQRDCELQKRNDELKYMEKDS